MKVKIGPYRSWIGVYQLADLLRKVGVSEDRCFKIGAWLSETWVQTLCAWIDSKKKRKVKVKIDRCDTWSLDHTLAQIILPCLKQLKEQNHGAPLVDDEDVPEELRSTNAPDTKEKWEADDNFHKRWDFVLDQMIWSFESIVDDSWEDQFRSGEIDILWDPCNDGSGCSEMKRGPNDSYKCDYEGIKKYQDRINNGLILFGKYFQNLWT